MKALALALLSSVVAICASCSDSSVVVYGACASPARGTSVPMFHGSRARLGWHDDEPDLAPSRVGTLASAWTSAPFPAVDLGGVHYVGRAYASPLYADDVRIDTGTVNGAAMSVVIVATSNGDVLALAASDTACGDRRLAAGTVVWRTRLVTPAQVPSLDGRTTGGPPVPGIALGVLSTPILDGDTLYVTAMDSVDGAFVWKAFALDMSNGHVRPSWPVALARPAVEAVNTNGPAYFDDDARVMSQRSALMLSPAGDRLYVPFGGYWDGAVGWLVAIDTRSPHVVASFSGAPDTLMVNGALSRHANAGMWAAGGPAIDDGGRIWITTGNSPEDSGPAPGTWGNSLLRLTPDLALDAAYTPFDYCDLDRRDVDVAGSSPILLPPLGDVAPATPNLVSFGGKSGVVYLVNRDDLAPPGTSRPACATGWQDAAKDRSLLPPDPAEPYCDGDPADPCAPRGTSTTCGRGPLWVFGPKGDDASIDRAKMRTTPAFFRDASGAPFVFVSGSTKAARCTADVVPPSLARLKIGSGADGAAYLALDATDSEISFVNPGSPVVTSSKGSGPVVWVVDQNARRTQPLLEAGTPAPVLYAVDGTTMKVLFRTGPKDLEVGGKYVTPAVAHGEVFVATDRLHAFAPH